MDSNKFRSIGKYANKSHNNEGEFHVKCLIIEKGTIGSYPTENTHFISKLTKVGARFVKWLIRVPGVYSLYIRPYSIEVQIANAFDKDEVIDQCATIIYNLYEKFVAEEEANNKRQQEKVVDECVARMMNNWAMYIMGVKCRYYGHDGAHYNNVNGKYVPVLSCLLNNETLHGRSPHLKCRYNNGTDVVCHLYK